MYFVGNSNPPVNTSVKQTFGNIAIGLLIDIRTSTILDASITLVSPLSMEFIRAQLVGRNLDSEIEEIIKNVERYQGPALKSIIVALRAVHNRYRSFIYSNEKVKI
ncbi:DUF3870 domain-containing protein [Mesobacillus foraminis]|nr:DUF3870 domain-containing protein [Mesobacillus foraminis]